MIDLFPDADGVCRASKRCLERALVGMTSRLQCACRVPICALWCAACTAVDPRAIVILWIVTLSMTMIFHVLSQRSVGPLSGAFMPLGAYTIFLILSNALCCRAVYSFAVFHTDVTVHHGSCGLQPRHFANFFAAHPRCIGRTLFGTANSGE